MLPVEAKEAFKEIRELYEKHKNNPKTEGRLSTHYTKSGTYIGYFDSTLLRDVFLEDITELDKKTSKGPKMPTYVETVCSHCGKEIVIFNSSRDGYDGVIDEDKQDKGSFPIIKKRRCRICKEEVYKMEVTISSTGKTDLFTEVDDRSIINEETWENAFDWITIDLECGKCGKKTKKYMDLETM